VRLLNSPSINRDSQEKWNRAFQGSLSTDVTQFLSHTSDQLSHSRQHVLRRPYSVFCTRLFPEPRQIYFDGFV
jgi:hypothetical protein